MNEKQKVILADGKEEKWFEKAVSILKQDLETDSTNFISEAETIAYDSTKQEDNNNHNEINTLHNDFTSTVKNNKYYMDNFENVLNYVIMLCCLVCMCLLLISI